MSSPENTDLSFIRAGVSSLQDDMAILKEILTGNGQPEHGLVVKVAKLEQSMSTVRKMFWLLVGGIFTSLGTVLFNIMTGN